MRAQTYQRTPTMAIASAMMLYPGYPFLASSFDSDGDSSGDNNQFNFTINRESLLNPNDIVMVEMIGEGSHSVVYKGLYKNQVPVAVKVVQPSRTAAVSKQHKAQFQNEVLFLERIKHGNIVKFFGACIEPQLMIITELLEGGSLQKFLWNCRPNTLDLKMSLSYALDISRAMEFLHSKGLIHRDLNPKNVLVTSDLKHVKLADFGRAREETTGCMTSEAGTYRWMAPEAFSREPLKIGEKLHYDHKIDVYSFAILFWELLINKQPFSGFLEIVVPYFVSQNERPSLTDIPAEVAAILESCWAEDPNVRPEFKEITMLLTNLLRRLCSGNNCGFIEQVTSSVCSNNSSGQTVIIHSIASDEDNIDEGSTNNPIQGHEGSTNNPVQGHEGSTNNPVQGHEGTTNNPVQGHEGSTTNPVQGHEGSTNNPVQGCNCREMKTKKKKGKNKKKVMKLILPIFKMFKACLYKP